MIELSLSFVWWHLVLAVTFVVWLAGFVSMLFISGWRMALLWPIYMILALFGLVNIQ